MQIFIAGTIIIGLCGMIMLFSSLFDFMDRNEKEYIHELARECVKVSTSHVVKETIDGKNSTEAVEEYNRKRKETLAQMFPSVYNTNTANKKEYE